MKKGLLILLLSFIGLPFSRAQQCYFTYSGAGANVLVFTSQVFLPTQSFGVSWDFGDGSTASGATVTHPYSAPGTYLVCSNVLDSIGQVFCTYCDSVYVSGFTSGCSFSALPSGTLNTTIHFVSNILTAGVIYQWYFGDGVSGTGDIVAHAYAAPGTYNVCMDVTDSISGNFLCNYCDSVNVNGTFTGCWYFAQPTDSTNSTWLFQNLPDTGTYNLWNFGDGNTGSGDSALHTYSSSGTYYACLYVIDIATGSIVCTYCDSIAAGIPSGNCSFTYSSSPANPLLIEFTSSAGAGSLVTWDFDDGSTDTGIVVNHTYSTPGSYNVCMVATPFLGPACTSCSIIVVDTSGGCSFSYQPDSVNNLLYTFAYNSSGNCTWDFGDGSTDSGSTVSHLYTGIGTYNVCVTEHDSSGNIICTGCIPVIVGNGTITCNASFLFSTLGLTSYFIDLSVPPVPGTSYIWDFGDGDTSSLRFPQHTYAFPGTYTACLTIYTPASPSNPACADTYCTPLTVDTSIIPPASCQALFAILQVAPYQVVVVNLSSGVNLTYSWDFGDGDTSSQAYPVHYYNSIGNYLLCLTVSDSTGCMNTYCDTLSVDSLGNIYRTNINGFTINVVSPSQITGIRDLPEKISFRVFPNPAAGDIYIICPPSRDITGYSLLSLEGKIITKGLIRAESTTVNTSGLAPGIYFLDIWDLAGRHGYSKIIKQ